MIREEIAVTSSGREVPRAMKVRAMTDSGTPRPAAIILPLSTRRLAPMAMTAAPTMSIRISFHIGLASVFFSSSSTSSSSILSLPERAWRTVIAMYTRNKRRRTIPMALVKTPVV